MELDEADEMVCALDSPLSWSLTAAQVSQMEIEIQGIPQSVRPQHQTRLRNAKAELAKFKKQLKDQNSSLARSTLLSSSGSAYPSSDEPYGPTSDRTRLLAGTSLLEEGTKRLHESQRLALETEEQGAGILLNLRTQREQIENSRNTVRLDTSKRNLWTNYGCS